MEYYGYELSAVTAIAILSCVDDYGSINEKKLNLTLEHMACFVPDLERRKELMTLCLHFPFEKALQVLDNMTYKKKRHFAAFLGSLIVAGGTITPREINFWTAVSTGINLPEMTIAEAAAIFLDNMGCDLSSDSSIGYRPTSSYTPQRSSSYIPESSSGCCVFFVVGLCAFISYCAYICF